MNNTELNRLIEEMADSYLKEAGTHDTPNITRYDFGRGALAALQSAEILQAAGLVKQEWVRVGDDYPKHNQAVLCMRKKQDYDDLSYPIVCIYKEGNNSFVDCMYVIDVTHWMPLPTPPVNDKPIKD